MQGPTDPRDPPEGRDRETTIEKQGESIFPDHPVLLTQLEAIPINHDIRLDPVLIRE